MVLARFLPRDEAFFDYFREAAEVAAEAALLLADILDQANEVERKARRIRDLEHQGDEITHRVYQALNSTFVTPLDREDIRSLASSLDDFIDYVEEVARRIALYRLASSTDLARLLTRIIAEQAQVLAKAVPLMEHDKRHDEVLRWVVEINRLENEADDTLSRALAGLYDGVTDVSSLIQAIRWGELYQLLEDATDRAEQVANTLEAIVVKYA